MRRPKSKRSPAGPVVISAKISASRTGESSRSYTASSAESPRCSASYTAPEWWATSRTRRSGAPRDARCQALSIGWNPVSRSLEAYPDVMHPGRGDEQASFVFGERLRGFDGSGSDGLSAQPTVPQRRQQRLGQLGGSLGRIQHSRHDQHRTQRADRLTPNRGPGHQRGRSFSSSSSARARRGLPPVSAPAGRARRRAACCGRTGGKPAVAGAVGSTTLASRFGASLADHGPKSNEP